MSEQKKNKMIEALAATTSYAELKMLYEIYGCKFTVSDLKELFLEAFNKDRHNAFVLVEQQSSSPYRSPFTFELSPYPHKSVWKDEKIPLATDAIIKVVSEDENAKKKIANLGMIRMLKNFIGSIDFTRDRSDKDVIQATLMMKLMDFGSMCCKLWLETSKEKKEEREAKGKAKKRR